VQPDHTVGGVGGLSHGIMGSLVLGRGGECGRAGHRATPEKQSNASDRVGIRSPTAAAFGKGP
jgi:hypothetical protein